MAQIDADGNGTVDFDEFVCLMIKVLIEERNQPEELLEVFQAFDVDKDECINQQDLMVGFQNLGQPLDSEEAAKMINLYSTNGASLSFEDFVTMMMYDPTDPAIPDKKQ